MGLPLKRSRFWPALFATAAATLAMAAAGAPAQADAPIEGVWTFNGGKVGITDAPGGGFAGIVVAATKFAECTHPVGEEMWTQITAQPDGSYWGLHQWFFDTPDCVRNPTLGLTAFRVLKKGDSRFLRVCFSKPGINKQPTISSTGGFENASYGCADSALITPVPDLSSADLQRYLTWPRNRHCLGRKVLRIRISDPANDPLDKVVVSLRSGKLVRKAKLKDYPGGSLATLSLKGLPKAQFKVIVRVETVLGQKLSRKRRYRLCAVPKKRRAHAHRGQAR